MATGDQQYWAKMGEVAHADGVADLRALVRETLIMLGFERGYFIAPVTVDSRVPRLFGSFGLSPALVRHYRSYLHLIDPLPLAAVQEIVPFRWPDDLDTARLNRRQARFLSILDRFGLGRGFGVLCLGTEGRTGFLAVADPEHRAKKDEALVWRVQAMLQLAFARYCSIVRERVEPPALSSREIEVLHWLSRGKSNSVIAQILSISHPTVSIYVKRIFEKLNVTDRTSASIRAMSFGLIIPSDVDWLNERRVHWLELGPSQEDVDA